MNNNKNNKSLEEALGKLEEIAIDMQENEIDLEKALDLYKKGVEEARYCAELLKNIEQEVYTLQDEVDDILDIIDNQDKNNKKIAIKNKE